MTELKARFGSDWADALRSDLVVLPAVTGPDGPVLAVAPPIGGAGFAPGLADLLRKDHQFDGRVGQVSLAMATPGVGPVFCAVGLGEKAAVSFSIVRDALFSAARAMAGWRDCAVVLGAETARPEGSVRAAVEGWMLGRYGYAEGPDDSVTLVVGETAGQKASRREYEIGLATSRNANWVRRLVETPANELTPARLATIIAGRARELAVDVDVWSGEDLMRRGFGATLAVGAGSVNAPVVVALNPGRASARLGLAGKGITFDSGGLNLKRDPAEIAWMKSDMAAAAAVAGAVFAAAELGLDPDVTAILPLAENMPGGGALRPGDVVSHPDGLRTEVTDTDCEGRLVLADAVAYLAKGGVAAIIDVGTLSDGGGVGPLLWGCWATSAGLADRLVAAGEAAGQPGWRLPLRDEYDRLIASTVADIANAPLDVPDSGQLAATYLRRFAGAADWAHMDIGSSAYLEQEFAPWPKGATASPMLTLLQLMLDQGQTKHDDT
ncbi:MAG: leucyl aminopeptidase family protein [Rhodobacteraceae bacterium]|nr:leucyl aminopeptidase family protein [Paracoccaceae bacterium]